jgi:hypothetical protein
MRQHWLSLALFLASAIISIGLTVFGPETREFFVDNEQVVLTAEGGAEQYLTIRDVKQIGGWQKSEIAKEFGDSDPALFFNTYFFTNIGSEDIENGRIVYDDSFNPEGLIAARARAPLPNEPIGLIEPRRFAWNEFDKESEGKFAFDVPLLKAGETVTVQIIADEFGAVVPTFRAANVTNRSIIEQAVDGLVSDAAIDWGKAIEFAALLVFALSSFHLGRTFSGSALIDWTRRQLASPKAQSLEREDD